MAIPLTKSQPQPFKIGNGSKSLIIKIEPAAILNQLNLSEDYLVVVMPDDKEYKLPLKENLYFELNHDYTENNFYTVVLYFSGPHFFSLNSYMTNIDTKDSEVQTITISEKELSNVRLLVSDLEKIKNLGQGD